MPISNFLAIHFKSPADFIILFHFRRLIQFGGGEGLLLFGWFLYPLLLWPLFFFFFEKWYSKLDKHRKQFTHPK